MNESNERRSDRRHHHCAHDGSPDRGDKGRYDTLPEDFQGTVYTCPMHPEVRAPEPGDCPLCGMGLEPETVSLEEDDGGELRDMTRRFVIAAVLAVPLVFLSMGGLIPGVSMDALVPHSLRVWLELALATPIVLWSGWTFFVRGYRSVVRWNLNMF
ncbi:MAG: heavy metal-binding domain-containing protein, partial [Wenzhouxiangellaceae bacterium]